MIEFTTLIGPVFIGILIAVLGRILYDWIIGIKHVQAIEQLKTSVTEINNKYLEIEKVLLQKKGIPDCVTCMEKLDIEMNRDIKSLDNKVRELLEKVLISRQIPDCEKYHSEIYQAIDNLRDKISVITTNVKVSMTEIKNMNNITTRLTNLLDYIDRNNREQSRS